MDREIITDLGFACYYILRGFTKPVFPTSTKAAPSRRVFIPVGIPGDLPGESSGRLPLYVDGDEWHNIVVPVLNETQWNYLDRSANGPKFSFDPYYVINQIDKALDQSRVRYQESKRNDNGTNS